MTKRPVLRKLRGQSTDAERKLWREVRAGQIGGAKFRRQHQFGPYVLDFYCAEARLAVEVDGGQHYESARVLADRERTAYLALRGVRVVRFSNLDVLGAIDGVLEAIRQALVAPSPCPSPRGRGDVVRRSSL